MMSAAQYYPKLLSIMGNVLRFLPAFVRMKELLEEGYVGELLVCEAQVCTTFFSLESFSFCGVLSKCKTPQRFAKKKRKCLCNF